MQMRGERKREGSLETEVLEVWSGDGRAPSFLSRNKVSRSLSQGRRWCWARHRARWKSGKESYLYPPVRSLTQDCVHALRLHLSISLLVELWNTSCIFHHFKFQYCFNEKKKQSQVVLGICAPESKSTVNVLECCDKQKISFLPNLKLFLVVCSKQSKALN